MNETQADGATDIKAGRLGIEEYIHNFSDMHPPLGATSGLIEADRCYFCYDAPCTTACPTDIDIAGFIRMIAGGNNIGAARLILQENIMGGTCARVCPTEELCEQACVRNEQDDRPVNIGLLQRHAVDDAMAEDKQFFIRKPETGKRVAIVGAGPAGLSCAHGLAQEGHSVTMFEAKEKSGGLNEYGLAVYKMLDDFAAREVEYILEIGGITINHGQQLGRDISTQGLLDEYDAVFIGVGLGNTNNLGIDNETIDGVEDAVDYIESLRQSDSFATLPVGRRVVVIGGGMTAIDMATQIKMLGASEVTLAYRRGQEAMNASEKEQEFTQVKGVTVRHNAMPHKINASNGHLQSIEFERTETNSDGSLVGSGEYFTLAADMVFKAIGQSLVTEDLASVAIERGRVRVDENRCTSVTGLWAGGDCVLDGEDLTVSAVQDGKLAARSINKYLQD